eukprot:CAMPEP_0198233078 /NCGR_PEP_ID=MMETSP1445-20131203/116055_1 /TAXON_ID=36898 /ORGANISM="Pyramimonas sp., Strain CCMP2087" /LENGTH=761 /DNA_ID=CAMNT_0043913767 /DNA_START=303 /DNA_END=2588 /DNA_ORIENTATION=+
MPLPECSAPAVSSCRSALPEWLERSCIINSPNVQEEIKTARNRSALICVLGTLNCALLYGLYTVDLGRGILGVLFALLIADGWLLFVRFNPGPHLPPTAESPVPLIAACTTPRDQFEAASDHGMWRHVYSGDKANLLDEIRNDVTVLQTRGPCGETPLHVLLLHKHYELGKLIGARYPHLLSDVYLGKVYHGENCLHIAIVHRNAELVQFLLETGDPMAQLTAQADGDFFKPGKSCCYGGTAFNFAVSTNQRPIVEYLVRGYGADLMEATDCYGNTCLHMVAIHQLQDMYDCVMALWAEYGKGRKALTETRNVAGRTPLSEAAHRGEPAIFRHMLRATTTEFWKYGPITCLVLPLKGLDIGPRLALYKNTQECPNKSDLKLDHLGLVVAHPQQQKNESKDYQDWGALQEILQEGHTRLLELPLIQELVNIKWEKYAYREFKKRFYWSLANALIFTLMIVIDVPPDVYFMHQWTHVATFWSCKTFTLTRAILKLGVELREMQSQGRAYFQCVGGHMFENLASLGFSCTFILSQTCELLGFLFFPQLLSLSNSVLAFSAVFCWMYLLWFFLGNQKTGHLVVMIWTILTGDMVVFGMVASVVLVGFSVAFFVSLTEREDRGFSTFVTQVFQCYHMMTSGGFEKDEFEKSDSWLGSLFLAYSVLVTILLLNLLIAMMGNTFTQVNEQARQKWMLERARIIQQIDIELSTSPLGFLPYLDLYAKEERGSCRHILEIQEVAEMWSYQEPTLGEARSDYSSPGNVIVD